MHKWNPCDVLDALGVLDGVVGEKVNALVVG
jgi:hypothetical protein